MWLGVLGGASTAFLAAAWPLGGKEQPSKPLRHHTADGADRNFVCAIFGGDLGLCGLVVALMLREWCSYCSGGGGGGGGAGGGGGGMDLDPAPLNCPSPPDGDVVSPPTVNARAAFGIEVFLRLGHVVTAKLNQLC